MRKRKVEEMRCGVGARLQAGLLGLGSLHQLLWLEGGPVLLAPLHPPTPQGLGPLPCGNR